MGEFIVREGSLQEKFLNSRNKVQFYGGGYGNGKTSCACIKAIQIMKDYPNSYGAVLRATLPKVKGTTMKEFFKWLPSEWIKCFNKNDRELELINGSKCLFTYLGQKGEGDNTTSNVLSSTFDWVLVDQFEDPEFSYKDFTDLLGRLRGSATYDGDDDTMPKTGPRWLFFLCNPTRNWVYHKIVKPFHNYLRDGTISEDLLQSDGNVLIDIIEGSTYDNKDNLPADFIETLEASYKGQMKDRFLKGEWSAYEGLVYPEFDYSMHCLTENKMLDILEKTNQEVSVNFIESFDFGVASPSCYLFAFVAYDGSICVIDGFYESNLSYDEISKRILNTRLKYFAGNRLIVKCDPAIFRRITANPSTSDELLRRGIICTKADNDILNGIQKVQNHLMVRKDRIHLGTGDNNAPKIYFSDKLYFLDKEFTGYYWMKNSDDQYIDKTVDKDDHAMDSLKYLLTDVPMNGIVLKKKSSPFDKLFEWREK